MPNTKQAESVVFAAIDQVNRMLPADQKIPKETGAILYGTNAIIPSLMLMNLIVAVEEIAEDEHDAEVSISGGIITVQDLVNQVAANL
jgi:hypothetical protein